MKNLTKNALMALTATLFLASCSRSYAPVQRTPMDRFTTQRTESTPIVAPTPTEAVAAESVATAVASPVTETPTAPVAELQSVQRQLNEAVASTNGALTANKKYQKRMEKVQTLLTAATEKAAVAPVATTSARKLTLAERVMLKKMDKQVKKQLSPNDKAATSLNNLTIAGIVLIVLGLIVAVALSGLIGLVLLLVGVLLLLLGLLQ